MARVDWRMVLRVKTSWRWLVARDDQALLPASHSIAARAGRANYPNERSKGRIGPAAGATSAAESRRVPPTPRLERAVADRATARVLWRGRAPCRVHRSDCSK